MNPEDETTERDFRLPALDTYEAFVQESNRRVFMAHDPLRPELVPPPGLVEPKATVVDVNIPAVLGHRGVLPVGETVVDLNIPAVRAAGARADGDDGDLPETVVDLNLGAVLVVRDPELDLDRTEPVNFGRQVPVPSVPTSMLAGEFDPTKT
jgi:hypothetical protein